MFRSRVSLTCLVALVFGLGAGDAFAKWPFGAKQGPAGRGGDYYNLGVLGAKARDADAPKPKIQDMGGGMRRGTSERPTNDNGPQRLEVVLLFSGGAAEKAGLQIGDLILGIGSRPFKEGSLGPLAEALVKAEAGAKKGVLKLLVERDGKKQKLEVQVPQGGKVASKPTQGAAREALINGGLAFLAKEQQRSGGYKQTLSGANGAVIQASLAGLAWLSAGSDLKQGTYKDNVTRAADFVSGWCARSGGSGSGLPGMDRPGGRGNWSQSNWGYAHAALFLGELHARTPAATIKRTLHLCADQLVKTQEKSGGWAHGPGGPNALGYVELNIVTGLALGGLGLAKQSGYSIPAETLEKAEAYLKASSGGGGVGYSSKPGQQGQGNIGRTAGCWLGYAALGLSGAPWAKKMRSFVEREAGNVLGGHASLMQHIFHAGVAAHALGKAAKAKFWKSCKRDLILARAPDGSFQPRPWHESLGMGSNSDVSFGQVWTTAAWTIVLSCEPSESKGRKSTHPGLPAWMGR